MKKCGCVEEILPTNENNFNYFMVEVVTLLCKKHWIRPKKIKSKRKTKRLRFKRKGE